MTKKQTMQITLTPAQQARIEQATGKHVARLKLEALEARVAPKLSAN
jgi:hypothetical protein